MRPTLLGILLVLHALAHAGAGTWAAGRHSPWVVVPAWLLSMCGFLAAGFGLLGLERLRAWAAPASAVAAVASLVLFRLAGFSVVMLVGLSLSVVLAMLVRWWSLRAHPEIHTPTIATSAALAADVDRPSLPRRAVALVAWLFLGYTALLILVRPWHHRWGSTAAERSGPVPGISDTLAHGYRIDRGITIDAPAAAVWPWVAQLGQDRGGFYSYDWLERAFGDDVRNADSLVPAWQDRQVGELVRAAQSDYLGGRLGRDLGWRIAHWDPPRAMVLENWGAFVVREVDSSTSRLTVHTRGEGRPSFEGVMLAPFGFYLFEPAHFIMERGMFLGIAARASRAR